MKPNFDLAAEKATETLIEYKITAAPVDPLPVLKKYPGVVVVPFAEAASSIGMERETLIDMFGDESRAAVTTIQQAEGENRYIVVYNQRMPFVLLQRALARELGHIVLKHDGVTRPYDVRMAEAMCFAHHLISPRPVIRMLQNEIPLTMNVLTDTTGCSDNCVEELRNIPGAHVPKEINRQVKDIFARGINEYIKFHKSAKKEDKSPLVDFGTYMENYEE